jgi:hypothetical protein
MIQQVTAHRETRDGLRTAVGYVDERILRNVAGHGE